MKKLALLPLILFFLVSSLIYAQEHRQQTSDIGLIKNVQSETFVKAFQNNGQGHEYDLTAPPGNHTFKITGVPKGGVWPGKPASRTEWYINGEYTNDLDNSFLISSDPSHNYGQSSGTYRVSAEIYNGDRDWIEAHHWNVTVENIDAKIDLVSISPSEVVVGRDLSFEYRVQNTGTDVYTFGIGATIQRKNGLSWDDYQPIDNIPSETLIPGAPTPLRERNYTLPANIPEGTYRVFVAVWDGDAGLSKQLDNDESPSFEVVPVNIDAEIDFLTEPPSEVIPGKLFSFSYHVQNTGNQTHTFGIGATIERRNGLEWETYEHIALSNMREEDLPPRSDTPSRTQEYMLSEGAPGGKYRLVIGVWDGDAGLSDQLDNDKSPFSVAGAEITGFSSPEDKTYKWGDKVQASVTVKNTGTIARSFWVGISFFSEKSGDWPDGWLDAVPFQTSDLNGGESEVLDFEYLIERDIPEGIYQIRASIWYGYDPNLDPFDPGLMTKPRFDNWEGPGFTLSDYGEDDPYGIAEYDNLGLFDKIPMAQRSGLADLDAMNKGVLTSEGDKILDSSTKKLLFFFHGWNHSWNNESPYLDESHPWKMLINNITLPADWELIPYFWRNDASLPIIPKPQITKSKFDSTAHHQKIIKEIILYYIIKTMGAIKGKQCCNARLRTWLDDHQKNGRTKCVKKS